MHDDDTREQALASSLLAQLNGARGELKRAELKSQKRLAEKLTAQVHARETLLAALEEEAAGMRDTYAAAGLPADWLPATLPPVSALRERLTAAQAAITAQEWPRVGFELSAVDELLARWRLRAPGGATHAVAALDRNCQHRTASASAGRRSGKARREQPAAIAARVRAEAARLEASQRPAREWASLIAQLCGCDPSYVRKVLKRPR